jgi:nucleotide-binding universal stress UspA family protein
MSRSTSFQSILVPLDGSPFAEQALPLAAELAKRGGGKLLLALVHQLPPNPLDTATANMFNFVELATRKSEQAYLDGYADKIRAAGIEVASAVTLEGPTVSSLVQYVQEAGIGLVVMATHGRGGMERAWLGSVADQLTRNVQVPVLLVRPTENGTVAAATEGKGQVLVPVDESTLAEEVLGPAAKVARLWGSEISVLQVVPPIALAQDAMASISSAYDEELTHLRRDQAQAYVERVAGYLRERGLRANGAAIVGARVADSILSVARPGQVSLIALATHGRGGLQRLAIGSVADKLVRGAAVPVLVYRPTGARNEKRSNRRAVSGKVAGKVVV